MLTRRNKDVDREILLKINSDQTLLSACQSDKYALSLCDNIFYQRRLKLTYPVAYNLKPDNLSWKDYYLMIVYYKDKMKREYNFDFIDGDAKKYYNFLALPYVPFNFNKYRIAEEATKIGDFKTIEYLINDFNNIKINKLLNIAAEYNKTDLVNYFIKKGATEFFKPLINSAKNGNLELLKLFIEKSGGFTSEEYNSALFNAANRNNLNIVKYLVDKNLATDLKSALRSMELIDNIEGINYLESKMKR